MRYIQNWFRGHLMEAIHIVKGPYPASDAANLVETWCGAVFQDRVGLLPGQEAKAWRQGVGSDHADTLCQKVGWWSDNRGVCGVCQEVLRIHTEYPGQLTAMDNDALYQEFRDAHDPDYYDGAFTTEGELRLRLAVAEMERRLQACGFLSKEEADDKRMVI